MRPLASIVIPSHNEAAIIGRLLTALAQMSENGELDVHVVCNGCNDDTYAVASGYAGVKVHDLAQASKSAALNLGDRVAGDVFPRIYLDADIMVDDQSIRKVVEALDDGSTLAAAPEFRVVLDGRPVVVRDFYRIFTRLPWVTDRLVGSGFYGVSREGRARFIEFPDILNDDLFFRSCFSYNDRRTVAGAEFFIEAPRTVSALIRAKARVHLGTHEFIAFQRTQRHVDRNDTAWQSTRRGIGRRVVVHLSAWARSELWRMARRPSLWRPLLSYTGVRFAAVIVARRPRLGDRDLGWAQDRTTRDATPS